jgi:hypothetical protein
VKPPRLGSFEVAACGAAVKDMLPVVEAGGVATKKAIEIRKASNSNAAKRAGDDRILHGMTQFCVQGSPRRKDRTGAAATNDRQSRGHAQATAFVIVTCLKRIYMKVK